MKKERVFEIIYNNTLTEVFYDQKPIWIQELNNDIAKVGFLDGSMDKNVFINDLYEKKM